MTGSLGNCTETQRNPISPKEPEEPKTETARTAPCTNRDRTEPECTKIAHRRSLAIKFFTADSGIAGNSAVGIKFVPFNRRENRRSLAIFFAEEIAHLGALPRGPCDRKNQSRSKISIPAWNFQSRSKITISIANFNPAVFLFTGPSWCFREGLDRKFQSTIDRSKFSIPKAAIDFFQSPGPLGKNRAILRGSGKNRRRNRRESRDFGALRTEPKKRQADLLSAFYDTPQLLRIYKGYFLETTSQGQKLPQRLK